MAGVCFMGVILGIALFFGYIKRDKLKFGITKRPIGGDE